MKPTEINDIYYKILDIYTFETSSSFSKSDLHNLVTHKNYVKHTIIAITQYIIISNKYLV